MFLPQLFKITIMGYSNRTSTIVVSSGVTVPNLYLINYRNFKIVRSASLAHSSCDADANQLLTEFGWDNLETRRQKLKAELVYKASHPIIWPQESFRGVMWLLLTICAILKISVLFPYHVITIIKIDLATVVQSPGTAYPQLLGKQHLWLISDDC